jgi:hypothetical protein
MTDRIYRRPRTLRPKSSGVVENRPLPFEGLALGTDEEREPTATCQLTDSIRITRRQ